MATALEQSFRDLLAEHNLASLSIDCNVRGFYSYAHGDGQCASGGGATIAEALSNSIAALHVKRLTTEPVALPDEALPAEEVAAGCGL